MLSSSSTNDASDVDTNSTLCTNLSPNGNNNGDSSSPKYSSSASSSLPRPLPLSHLIIISSTNENNPRKPKKMDDVWRDLSLGVGSSSSRSSGGVGTAAEGPTFNNNETKLTRRRRSVPSMGVSMQEFLGTFSRESSQGNNPPPNPNGVFTLFGSPIPIYVPPSATHTPTQADSSPAALASGSTHSLPEKGNSVLAGLPAALGGSNSRAPVSRRKTRKPSTDICARRARRKMMNRESAARSRERRKAYDSELEREIAFLTEENERLSREATLTHLVAAIAAHQVPEKRKPPFRRSSTPPF